MEDNSKRKKVLCPVSGKDGKTHWTRLGSAFLNRDGSYNVYLDALPVNGKLQLRDWDDSPWEKRDGQQEMPLQLPGKSSHLALVDANDDLPM